MKSYVAKKTKENNARYYLGSELDDDSSIVISLMEYKHFIKAILPLLTDDTLITFAEGHYLVTKDGELSQKCIHLEFSETSLIHGVTSQSLCTFLKSVIIENNQGWGTRKITGFTWYKGAKLPSSPWHEDKAFYFQVMMK